MDRRTITVAVIAALAIVAIGISAATLTTTVSDSGGSDREGTGTDETGIPVVNETEPENPPEQGELPSWLRRLLAVVSVLGLLGGILYLLLFRRRALLSLAVLAVGLILGWLFLRLLLPEIGQLFEGLFGDGLLPGEGGSGGETGDGNEADGRAFTTPSWLLVGGVLAALLIVALLVLRTAGPEANPPEDEGTGTENGTEEIGRIAGRAADRIEQGETAQVEAENEVYRAWREMVEQLDSQDTETTTPREFQQLAIDAGMGGEDVRELTGLFEQVRYGGESPTVDRERRALEVLRRIESRYGEGE